MVDRSTLPLKLSVFFALLIAPFIATVWFFGRSITTTPHFVHFLKRSVVGSPANIKPVAASIQAPRANVWRDLSDEEVHGVTKWLLGKKDLNLTDPESAGPWSNTILFVELNIPNKTDVLPYLDSNTSDKAPTKYARVLTTRRATEDASWQELLVGPLPISDKTTVQPLEYLLTRKTNGTVRWLDPDVHGALEKEFLFKVSASIADITKDLCGGVALGQDNDTIALVGLTTPYQEDTEGVIVRWDEFKRKPNSQFDTQTLLPLGLFLKTDVTGRDPSKWRVMGWFYNDIFYKDTESFRAAYQSPVFERLQPNVEGDWARTDRQGPPLQHDLLPPPNMLHPNGQARFSVDKDEQYVSWMDFTFYIGFSHDTGMSLYDIRYRGERVFHSGGGTNLRRDTICIFEYMADSPIQRHTAFSYLSITSNIYLTVRTVSTIADYDYVISYKFYMDGSIGVETQASGYIIAAHRAHNQDYGYRIHDHLSGSMHEHIINFKADFDISGTKNTVQLVRNIPVRQVYPWSNGKPRSTMQLQRLFVANEDESRLNWDDSEAQKQLIVVNRDALNEYGEMRGYQVVPAQPAAALHSRLTAVNSTSLGRTAGWSSHDVHITAQHDTEPRSAYPFNAHDLFDPPIDFDRFFDGESLNQTDLVVWFNLGMYHLPHSGDLPNTLTSTAHAGVKLMPVNYFSLDQTRRTANQIRMDFGKGKVSHLETFGRDMSKGGGAEGEGCCWMNSQTALAELNNYTSPVEGSSSADSI
ncbi:Membrane primary amine oxidase [Colletotrichum sidae]|uniref:Amine oxidase n=1 Tax=Colletotrichum sidae TaxID=1347389 RepID=A0A4R8T202_9PEZI|nr:Membrane primary amine oxidase [Colletotrichum sidae]